MAVELVDGHINYIVNVGKLEIVDLYREATTSMFFVCYKLVISEYR